MNIQFGAASLLCCCIGVTDLLDTVLVGIDTSEVECGEGLEGVVWCEGNAVMILHCQAWFEGGGSCPLSVTIMACNSTFLNTITIPCRIISALSSQSFCHEVISILVWSEDVVQVECVQSG